MCTASDFSRANPTTPVGGGVGAWVDNNRLNSGERSTASCAGWTDATTNFVGLELLPSGNTTTGTNAQYCSIARPLACCIPPRTVTFVGYTSSTFDGNLGGFVGANVKCSAAFPGSWFCTAPDFAKANPTAPVGGSVGAWVDNVVLSSGERSTASCAGWTDATTNFVGLELLPSGNTTTGTNAQYCSIARPLACCR